MTDIKQLIERLREFCCNCDHDLKQEAADALERLTQQPVGVEPVGYQRRHRYETAPGSQDQWKQCDFIEATTPDLRFPGYEYRPIHSAETVARLQASNGQLQVERDELAEELRDAAKALESEGRIIAARFAYEALAKIEGSKT